MASKFHLLFAACFCTAHAIPLGQTRTETITNQPSPFYPYYSPMPIPISPLPVGSTATTNVGSTATCETTPTLPLLPPYPLPGYPYPLPYYQPTSVQGSLGENVVSVYPYPNIPVSTTSCETTPNVVSVYPYPGVPLSTSTNCEATPNLVNYIPYPNPKISATETSVSMLPINSLGLPYPGLYPGLAPIGVPFL